MGVVAPPTWVVGRARSRCDTPAHGRRESILAGSTQLTPALRTIAAVVATGAVCLTPAVASAADMGTSRGYTYIKKSTTMKNGFKSDDVTAKCPGKTVSVGGGSDLNASGNEHRAWIAESSGFDPDGWFTSGAHLKVVGKVKLTSWAVCTKDSKAIHRYKKKARRSMRRGNVGSEARCKKGLPSGGGVRVTGSPKDYWISTSTPFGTTQRGTFLRGLDPGWSSRSLFRTDDATEITTDVTCMKGGAPEYPGGFFTTGEEIPYRRVTCRNKQSVTGGGFVANFGSAQAHIIQSRPFDSLNDKNKVPDDGWSVKFYNDSGNTQEFALTAACR